MLDNEDYLDPYSHPPQTVMKTSDSDATGPDLAPPSEWRYRIEGGEKVFFSHLGTVESRVREHVPKVLCVDLASRLSSSRPVRREKYNQQALFLRYLGRYLLHPIPVWLSDTYLCHLADAAETLRPPARRRVKNFSSASPNAELFPDLALRFGSETVLVELKPKCGVLSRSALVHPQITDALLKFIVPPYYFKNYFFRDSNGEMRKLPDAEHRYDPVKLLSGKDIRNQLQILHDERGRGLRLFNHGTRLEHTEAIRVCNDGFCETALDVAAKVLADVPPDGESCLRSLRLIQCHDYIDNIGAGLLLQRLMEQVGKSRAYEMIQEYVFQDGRGVLFIEDEEELFAAKSIVSYKTPEEARRLHSLERYVRAIAEVKKMRPSVCARMLADFMQSAAAKDCSLMVSMCPEEKAAYKHPNMASSNEHFGFVRHSAQRWVFSIHVIDVGMKNVDKILNKWPALDFKMKNHFFSAGPLDRLL